MELYYCSKLLHCVAHIWSMVLSSKNKPYMRKIHDKPYIPTILVYRSLFGTTQKSDLFNQKTKYPRPVSAERSVMLFLSMIKPYLSGPKTDLHPACEPSFRLYPYLAFLWACMMYWESGRNGKKGGTHSSPFPFLSFSFQDMDGHKDTWWSNGTYSGA